MSIPDPRLLLTPPGDPAAWPVCVKCGTAWALHRRLVDHHDEADGVPPLRFRWIWMRECGHRRAGWSLANENGPVDIA